MRERRVGTVAKGWGGGRSEICGGKLEGPGVDTHREREREAWRGWTGQVHKLLSDATWLPRYINTYTY
jgi:hypothetical protein